MVSRIVGADRFGRLQQVLDGAGRALPLAGDGVVLSEALAAKLGVTPGETVAIELLDGAGRSRTGVVSGLARDFSGFQAYMDRRALNRLIGEGDLADGAQLVVAASAREAFYRAVAKIPRILGASSRDETVAAWRKALAEAFQVTISFYVAFAAAIAFGVAYNMVRISLSERSRDLATLHVLGFGRGDCAYILVGELVILALAAIPIGLLGGYAMAHGLVAAYSRDDVRLPAIIGARSYGLALAAYLGAVALGGAGGAPHLQSRPRFRPEDPGVSRAEDEVGPMGVGRPGRGDRRSQPVAAARPAHGGGRGRRGAHRPVR